MSVYLTFDETAGEQVATNHGWSLFCAWAESVPGLKDFVDHGMGKPGEIANILADAPPPADADTANVAAGLRSLLLANDTQEVAFLTTGMGP